MWGDHDLLAHDLRFAHGLECEALNELLSGKRMLEEET
jgi:hypothetical protein